MSVQQRDLINRRVNRDGRFDTLRVIGNQALPTKVLATEPVRQRGTLLFNETDGNIYYSNGVAWVRIINSINADACITDADADTEVCVDNGFDPDTITFTNAGVERARFTATGVFAVGTAFPDAGFIAQFQGDAKVVGIIDQRGTEYQEQASAPGTGGVGIGRVWVKNDTPNTLIFTNDAGADTVLGVPFPDIVNNTNTTSINTETVTNTLTFVTSSSERMRITSTGQVAIGTTSPSPGKAFSVVGDVNISGMIDPTGVEFVEQATPPGTGGAGTGRIWVRNDTPTALIFTDDVGSDIVIGSPQPAIENAGDTTSIDTEVVVDTITFVTASAERARILSTGELLVGTTSSTLVSGQTVEVSGGIKATAGTVDHIGAEIREQATVPGTGGAGIGRVWVRDDAPNVMVFTDDTGTDTILGGGGTLGPRVYECIVDAGGEGDYLSIGAAITAGCTRLFVRAGAYSESSDVVVPDGGIIRGEKGATLTLTTGARIIADGSGGTTETAGTVTILSGTASLTGVGTTFTNLSPGDHVLLGDQYYSIFTTPTDTSIVLNTAYRGVSLSGVAWLGQSMLSGIEISNIDIVGSTTAAIFLRACQDCTLNNLVISGGLNGLSIESCASVKVTSSTIKNATAANILIDDSTAISIDGVTTTNATTHGISITGSAISGSNAISSSFANNNTLDGINVASSRCNISTCVLINNGANGVNLVSTSSGTSVVGCTSTSNGADGIFVAGDNCMVSNCRSTSNVESGVEVDAASTNSIITSNSLTGNTGTNLVDAGTGTVSANNVTV